MVAVCGLALVVTGPRRVSAVASRASLRWRLLLPLAGTRARLRCATVWDIPGPGIEPMSPPVASGFLATAPRGKSYNCLLAGI